MNDTTTILTEARRLVDEVGWTQGALGRRDGRPLLQAFELPYADCFCASGAVVYASASFPYSRRNAAVRVLEMAAPEEGRLTVDYNDDPDTTKADVLAMFDRAIEASKEYP